jgi:hypothetical protein
MTLDPPMVTEVILQVADGIESLAFHPKGHMAVIACLEDLPWLESLYKVGFLRKPLSRAEDSAL